MEADITSQAVGLGSSVDFSLMSLFLRADIVVKSVIVILIAASIYSWAIIIEKFKMFKKINQSTVEFEEKFWKSKSAESFYNNLPANKDASRTKAIEIYPYFSSKLSKKKDANKADAILISSFYYQNTKY